MADSLCLQCQNRSCLHEHLHGVQLLTLGVNCVISQGFLPVQPQLILSFSSNQEHEAWLCYCSATQQQISGNALIITVLFFPCFSQWKHWRSCEQDRLYVVCTISGAYSLKLQEYLVGPQRWSKMDLFKEKSSCLAVRLFTAVTLVLNYRDQAEEFATLTRSGAPLLLSVGVSSKAEQRVGSSPSGANWQSTLVGFHLVSLSSWRALTEGARGKAS